LVETSTGAFLDLLPSGPCFLSGELTLGRTCLVVSDFGTIDRDRFSGISVATTVSGLSRVGHIGQGHSPYFGIGASIDSVPADALVDDGVVIPNDIVVDHGGVVVDLLGTIAIDPVIVLRVVASTEVAAIDE
jgi:hypothetical protein